MQLCNSAAHLLFLALGVSKSLEHKLQVSYTLCCERCQSCQRSSLAHCTLHLFVQGVFEGQDAANKFAFGMVMKGGKDSGLGQSVFVQVSVVACQYDAMPIGCLAAWNGSLGCRENTEVL